MTILVGYATAREGRAALDLVAQIARSGIREPVVVATVPQPWATPSPAKVDAEYAAWAADVGDAVLTEAREYLAATAPDIVAGYQAITGRSITRALLDAADESGADVIVLGSSRNGPIGQVVVSATAEPLLHSSPIAIALAPRGYRAAGSGLHRITCAFSGTEESAELLTATAGWANRLAVPLRIATFGVRGQTMYPSGVGYRAEDAVLDEWSRQAETAQYRATERMRRLDTLPPDFESVIGTGPGWHEALDDVPWERDEILVVGSTAVGPIKRVFVGSNAIRVVRHSPVPVLVVPGAQVAVEVLVEGPVPSDR